MKVWNLVFISVGLMITLHLFGFPIGITGDVLDVVGITFNNSGGAPEIANVTASDSKLYNLLFKDTGDTKGILIALGLGLGAVIVGLLTRAKPENLILIPVILILVAFISSYIALLSYVISQGNAWMTTIVTLVFLPIIVGFIIALAEFFRGTD